MDNAFGVIHNSASFAHKAPKRVRLPINKHFLFDLLPGEAKFRGAIHSLGELGLILRVYLAFDAEVAFLSVIEIQMGNRLVAMWT